MKIIALHQAANATAYYRIGQPYIIAGEMEGIQTYVGSVEELAQAVNTMSDFNVLVLSNPSQIELLHFVKAFKRGGVKIVIDLDDDYWSLPKHNPVYDLYHNQGAIKSMEEFVKYCDLVTVSTPELSKVVKKFNPNVHVKLNTVFAIDANRDTERKKLNIKADEKVIMWGGSATHQVDLKMAVPALKTLLQANKNYKFLYCGNEAEFKRLDFLLCHNTQVLPWRDMREYWRNIAAADVFIAPLSNSRFNRSKSELKCLEAARVNVPIIGTDIAPYRRFEIEVSCHLVNNDKDDWRDTIRNIIDIELAGESAISKMTFEKYNPHTHTNALINAIKQL
jgi:glycosyltransferase involved in cell wall biosynthesis